MGVADEIKAGTERVEGAANEALGNLRSDPSEVAKGKAQQAQGQAEHEWSQAKVKLPSDHAFDGR